MSRRALRERQEASSVSVVETRRERRDRELAAASAAASFASENLPAATSASALTPAAAATTPAAVGRSAQATPADSRASAAADSASAPTRRSRRDISGLEHLILAPVGETPKRAATAESTPSVAETVPAASEAAVPAPAVTPVAHTSVHTMRFSREDETPAAARVAAPRQARSSLSAADARRSVVPRLRRTGGSTGPISRKRTIVNSVVMVATAGLVATLALPAYAYDANTDGLPNVNTSASSGLGIQSLTVAGVNGQSSTRDDYSTTGNVAAMDSTTGTTVSPTVQALAAELMADVASGKLVGSVPDHIVEIRNLANGVAVPGCGVDYRVLQTIKVAVDNFDKVGVSDINRHCTGQIEGAGTASSHYKDGGGHAVDFYILNGHGLTGADSDSLKLIRLLDPLVPQGSGLGQSECGRSISVSNFAPFPDTCTHMHVDFGNAQGVALKS